MSRSRKPLGIAFVLAVAAVAVGWVVWRERPLPPPHVAVDDADPAVREAVRRARDEVRQQPRSAQAWGRLGMVLRVHDFDAPANVCLAEAARLDPAEARWPYLLGRSLWHHEPNNALSRLGKAVELAADKPVALRLKLTECLIELGQLDEADKHVRRAFEVEPANVRAHLAAGQLAVARGDWTGSVDHLRRCALSPFARQRAHALLATAYRRLDRAPEAAAAAHKSRRLPADLDFDRLDPFIDEVFQLGVGKGHRLAAASSLQMQGRHSEAVAAFRAVARDYPEALTSVKLAEALLRNSDFAEAAHVANAALEQDANSAQAHFYLGVAGFHLAERRWHDPAVHHQTRAQLSEAIASLLKATQLKPAHGFAYNYLGLAHRLQRRLADALAAFRQAIRSDPSFVDPHVHLANVWTDLGCAAVALIHLHEALRLVDEEDARLQQTQERVVALCVLRGLL